MFLLLHILPCPALADVARPILPDNRDPSDTLAVLLSIPETDIDLTWSKLSIDMLLDADADMGADMAEIASIATALLARIGDNSTSAARVAALRAYLYESGEWNDHAPYSYDFSNSAGMRASQKTLHSYLQTRRGNCINMPMLFLAIGERMGVTMNVTTAPQHVFIQFEDPETGIVQHLETTSGAKPQRIVWQRQILPMTDQSITSGMYMKRLTKRQQVAVMGEALLHLSQERADHYERIQLAKLILSHFPECDAALLHLADASRKLIEAEVLPHYQRMEEMPADALKRFESWTHSYDFAVFELNRLGWQPSTSNTAVRFPDHTGP